jgi:polyhydroxyalkanoate synthesis regulator phasin
MKSLIAVILGAFTIGVVVLTMGGASAQEGGDPQTAERPGEKFISKTAENLGVSSDELTAAMTAAQFELIDEGVAEGRLTEEQAAQLKARIEEYGPLAGIGAFARHRGDRPGDRERNRECRAFKFVIGAAAQVLEMERSEILAALQSGKSLADLAEEQGMSVDEFTASLLGQIKSQLEAKVGEGKITQEQADKIFAGIEAEIDAIVKFHGQPGQNPCFRPGHDRPPRSEGQRPEGRGSRSR